MVATPAVAMAMATWTGYRLNLFAFRMASAKKGRTRRSRRGLVNNSFDFHFRVLSRHHQQHQQMKQQLLGNNKHGAKIIRNSFV